MNTKMKKLILQRENHAQSEQPSYTYKYNGKELQEELGLNVYDYVARNYDPAIGRWFNLDTLAEQMRIPNRIFIRKIKLLLKVSSNDLAQMLNK